MKLLAFPHEVGEKNLHAYDLFGGPATRMLRTRDSASPDYSGFALVGDKTLKQ
jgi:hypothetical protein